MKESTLLEMQNKIKAMTNVLQQLINEQMHLRELSVGTLEALKLMPGYEKAIEDLKKEVINKKEDKDGVKQQDTK
jgi:peptidyl-tRNA hydrolase|tara:strand:- start:806 stop:1030 length:225 start_codon:yes stop_codon:yes gene_type:complete